MAMGSSWLGCRSARSSRIFRSSIAATKPVGRILGTHFVTTRAKMSIIAPRAKRCANTGRTERLKAASIGLRSPSAGAVPSRNGVRAARFAGSPSTGTKRRGRPPATWCPPRSMSAPVANGKRPKLFFRNSSCVWDCGGYACAGSGMSPSSSTSPPPPKISND